MSSPLLFKIAGTMLALTPIGHIKMFQEVLSPALASLGTKPAAYAAKVSWNQANGYFILSALLCFKWATTGVRESFDKYLLWTMLATHLGAGGAYAKKGIFPPVLVYWGTSILLGIAGTREV